MILRTFTQDVDSKRHLCVLGVMYLCVRGHVYMCARGHVYVC
jgi:hypothetical protein